MIEFKEFYKLLNEGGVVKHMLHPFELPNVNTGNQLLNLFDRVVRQMKRKPAAVKWDGVNVSFRLVEGPNGIEWAMDRGSMQPVDVEGITIDKLGVKFKPTISQDPETGNVLTVPHGMIEAGRITLSILNDTLPELQKEIKQLKLTKSFDGHDAYFINAEWVKKGGTNVIKYGKNLLAFHGINKLEHISGTNPKTGRQINKRDSLEVSYNEKAFNELVSKVKSHAKRYDYGAYGSVSTKFIKEPDFQQALDTKLEIIMSAEESYTKTLGMLLKTVRNPHNEKIKMNNISVGAMQKKVYQYVIGEDNVSAGPLNEMFEEKDIKTAIDAAVLWHTTRLFGREILTSIVDVEGDLIQKHDVHEAVVIRDLSAGHGKFHPPIKVSGDFIVAGADSPFAK
jgi:hypothetical protein